MKQEHYEFDCFCSGLVISKDYPFIAATPDAFRQCACCGKGVVEIKCPYCTKDLEPGISACLKDGSLPSSHHYYYQVQTQMLACDVQFADFVVCTFPNDTPTLCIQRIKIIDEDFLSSCIEKSRDLHKVAILPELLGRWFTRSIVMPIVDDRNDLSYKYCYCKEELGGQMIHCDNDENCPHGEWFLLRTDGNDNSTRLK